MVYKGLNIMHVAGLHVYPVKGGRGIDLTSTAVMHMGLAHDRQWMIVNAEGMFLTQRDTPQLAQLAVTVDATGDLTLSVAGHFSTRVAIPSADDAHMSVTVWKSTLDAIPARGAISENLSAWLGETVRLVRFPPRHARLSNPAWAGDTAPVGFADAYPVLIAVADSLDALNSRLQAPLPMSRFRANIIIGGATAWADDGWQRIKIGAVELDLVKPCDRCIVTTTDQMTGERAGPEPLTTLAKMRRADIEGMNGVVFGTNAVPRSLGTISVGDAIEILATRTPWKIRAENTA